MKSLSGSPDVERGVSMRNQSQPYFKEFCDLYFVLKISIILIILCNQYVNELMDFM